MKIVLVFRILSLPQVPKKIGDFSKICKKKLVFFRTICHSCNLQQLFQRFLIKEKRTIVIFGYCWYIWHPFQGFICALTGVLCIALPVPSIVQNFHRIYQEDRVKNPIEMVELLNDDPDLVDRLKRRFVHSAINRT